MKKKISVIALSVGILFVTSVTNVYAATYYVCRGNGHSIGTYSYSTALVHRGHGDWCNPPIGIWGG